jgi:hypothetical protein
MPFNGEMKEGRRGNFFPSVVVVGDDHGGGTRLAGSGGCLLCFCAGGGRKSVGPGGPKGRVGQLGR